MNIQPKRILVAAAAVLTLALSGCAATFVNHGYIPPAEEIEMILPGVDTRASVEETIGLPSAAGVMEADAWFYVASRQRHFTFHAPEVVEREILAITFDGRGVVENIYELGLEDGEIIRLSRRVTGTSIREVTLLRQIASNFGRVNIANALGGE